MGYRCSNCGELHEGLPDIGMDRPAAWFSVPEAERADRVKLDADTCIIDGQEFHIRGVIEIPIHDHPETFGIGAWVSQKKENFFTYLDNYDSSTIGPFFGWLCCTVAYYEEDTLLLKTRAHFRGKGLRPSIELEPTKHQLSIDQHNGISLVKRGRSFTTISIRLTDKSLSPDLSISLIVSSVLAHRYLAA